MNSTFVAVWGNGPVTVRVSIEFMCVKTNSDAWHVQYFKAAFEYKPIGRSIRFEIPSAESFLPAANAEQPCVLYARFDVKQGPSADHGIL